MAAPGIFGPKLLSLISNSTAVASFGSSRAKFLATCAEFFFGVPRFEPVVEPTGKPLLLVDVALAVDGGIFSGCEAAKIGFCSIGICVGFKGWSG